MASFNEFLVSSSMHGLKYVGQTNRRPIIRILWAAVFLASFTWSLKCCYDLWTNTTNVITTYDPMNSQQSIAFPAVTICTGNMVSKAKLNAQLQTGRYGNVSQELIINMQRALMTNRKILVDQEFVNASVILARSNITAIDLIDLFEQTSPNCQEFLMACRWKSIYFQDCHQYFKKGPTGDGRSCCTLGAGSYVVPALGFPPTEQQEENERGLSVVLNSDVDDYTSSFGSFTGFQVLLHNRNELPRVDDFGFLVGPGDETQVGVEYVSYKNTDEIKVLKPEQRACYVDNEFSLEYFDSYTYSACLLESDINEVVGSCGCRPFYFKANDSVAFCNFDEMSCLSEARMRAKKRGGLGSKCLSTCTEHWYTAEISSASLSVDANIFNSPVYKYLKDKNQSATYKLSKLNIHFRSQLAGFYKMDLRTKTVDFISAIGGVLGLGFGFSFISIVELCFLMSRRHLCHLINESKPI